METLTEAMNRLRSAGYDSTADATDEGMLRCQDCGTLHDPDQVRVDEVDRFEGASDPGDEAILVAFGCPCGRRVLYTAAYGPGTPASDAEVLRRLPNS